MGLSRALATHSPWLTHTTLQGRKWHEQHGHFWTLSCPWPRCMENGTEHKVWPLALMVTFSWTRRMLKTRKWQGTRRSDKVTKTRRSDKHRNTLVDTLTSPHHTARKEGVTSTETDWLYALTRLQHIARIEERSLLHRNTLGGRSDLPTSNYK